jgi:hypothetical protein
MANYNFDRRTLLSTTAATTSRAQSNGSVDDGIVGGKTAGLIAHRGGV